MIESNVLNFVEIGDSIQLMNVYSKGFIIKMFKIFKILNYYKISNLIIQIIFKIVFFIQLIYLSIIGMQKKDDKLIKLIKSIEKIIFLPYNINDKKSYYFYLICCFIICLFFILSLIYIIIIVNKNNIKKISEFPIKFISLFNLLLQNYGLCQFINIFLLSIKCSEKRHIYIKLKCFSETKHLIIVIISIILLIIVIFYSFILSIYINDIGNLQNESNIIRVNTNFELLEFTFSLIFYIFCFIQKYYLDFEKENYIYIAQGIIFCFSLIIIVYIYRSLYFYYQNLNYLYIFGWSTITWFSFCIIIKNIIKLNNSLLFFLFGMVIFYLALYFIENNRIDYCLTELNIFEAKNLKQIETYIHYLILLLTENSNSSRIIITGIINNFQEIISSSIELIEKSNKFMNNKYLNKKFERNEIKFKIYNIILLIYDYYFDKPNYKNNVLFLLCYFYINHLKNYTYPSYLCSIIKINNHKEMFLKYLLMEKSKKFQIDKLTKNFKKEKIKNIEIGAVIQYNYLIENFKLKIYDATSNQIEYFDILKNTNNTPKTTPNFLKTGNAIIKLRKEIIEHWKKILKLNPFNEENERDYMLYVENIIQDYDLSQKERLKSNQSRNIKLFEKNNIYYQIFDKDNCAVALIDGYINNGKILYSTPNFPGLFNYQPKDCIGITIYDLQPPNVAKYHKEIVEYSLKYSNLTTIYNKYVRAVLKGKNNSIYNINAFIKCLPSLKRGLIYIGLIEKIKDETFTFITDNNFKITCMSDPLSLSEGSVTLGKNAAYGMTPNIIGHHIALVIPEILKYLEVNEDGNIMFLKDNIELKAYLYPNVNGFAEYEKKIELILNKIRQTGKLINEEENKRDSSLIAFGSSLNLNLTKFPKIKSNDSEYRELIRDLNSEFGDKKYNIFFKVLISSFINGKYWYYRFLITNNIIILYNNKNEQTSLKEEEQLIENDGTINSKNKGLSLIPKTKYIYNKYYKGIKIEINEDSKLLMNEKENNNINNQNLFLEANKETSSLKNNNIFYKLKSYIIDNKEPKYISYARIILLLYCLVSIVIIYIDVERAQSKLNNLKDYLSQNLFFNKTKISTSCLYSTAVNLKSIKYEQQMFLDCKNESCHNVYSSLFYECFNVLRENMEGFLYYDSDFQDIFHTRRDVTIYALDYVTFIHTLMDTGNYMFLFSSNALLIYHNRETYLNNYNSTVDAYVENLLNLTNYFTLTEEIKGFSKREIMEKLKEERFKKSYVIFFINLIIFLGSFFILCYFSIRLYNTEIYFAKKLIKFSNPKFEYYLKYLEDIKKRLRNDTGEEDDNVFGEKENNSEEEGSENKKKDENKEKSNEVDLKKTMKDSKKKDRKKMSNKLAKITQQRNEKYKVMSKYFLFNTILFSIKFSSLLIIYMSYYLIINRVFNNNRSSFIEFDQISNTISGYFREIAIILVKIRKQDENNIEFSLLKNNAINLLKNNTSSIVNFNNKNYSYDMLNELESQYYKYNYEEYEVPIIGNLILPLIKDVSETDSTSPEAKLKQFFNGDSCSLMFDKEEDIFSFNNCLTFWSSIFLQGFEQVLLQLNIVINNYLKYIDDYNNGFKTYENILDSIDSLYKFFDLYYIPGYLAVNKYFKIIREKKIDKFNSHFDIIKWIYIIIAILLCLLLFLVIYSFKIILTSFLNFIAILPIHYLIEDEDFYEDVVKLEKKLY